MESRKRTLTNLIFIICISIISFIGVNFLACNFLIPGSVYRANIMGGLKNQPDINCKESERRGYDVMLTLLTTIIALKTKMDDDK